MDESILQGLKSQFQKHRIVFWYDAKKEMREQFDNLELDGIEKIEINNEDLNKFLPLLKLYDRADILNDIV